MSRIHQTPPWSDLTVLPIEETIGKGCQGLPLPRRLMRWAVLALAGVHASPFATEVVDWKHVRHLLVIRVDGIGDVVMTSAFLRELRRGRPSVRISLLVSQSSYDLVEVCPYVDDVLALPKRSSRLARWTLGVYHLVRFGRRLGRNGMIDLVISPRWDFESFGNNLYSVVTGARWRIGYSEQVNLKKAAVNRGYDTLFTHLIDRRTPRHEVESNLDVLRCLSIVPEDDRLEVWSTEEDMVKTEKMLEARRKTKGRMLVALAPGAGLATKVWPVGRFAEVGAWLRTKYGADIAIVGGEAERKVGLQLQMAIGDGAMSVAGELTLRQTAVLLGKCALLVSNDTAVVHMAAAAKVPVVVISACHEAADPCAVQSPARFAPWRCRHSIVQPRAVERSCSDGCRASKPHCILGVHADEVCKAVQGLMGAGCCDEIAVTT